MIYKIKIGIRPETRAGDHSAGGEISRRSAARILTALLPITVPDKRDRLTVVRTPVYAGRPKDALRLAVQSCGTSLLDHYILRLDDEIQAPCVNCEQNIVARLLR